MRFFRFLGSDINRDDSFFHSRPEVPILNDVLAVGLVNKLDIDKTRILKVIIHGLDRDRAGDSAAVRRGIVQYILRQVSFAQYIAERHPASGPQYPEGIIHHLLLVR